jgi:hypothetical protein
LKVTSREKSTGEDDKSRQRDDKSKKRKVRTDDDGASKEKQKQTCGLCQDSAYGLMVWHLVEPHFSVLNPEAASKA